MRVAILSLVLVLVGGVAEAASTPGHATAPSPPAGAIEPVTPLAEASESEREAIEVLQGSLAWTRRVMALLRLQRFDCPESATLVADALHDRHAAVRCFALLVLGHRGVPQDSAWLETETEPTVIRTALRTGFRIDPLRLSRGVAALARSSQLPDKLLAAELALLSDDPELHELATELVKTVILRMDDQEAGALSPRLARLTESDDLRRGYRWRNWWKRHRRVPLNDARILPLRPP
ncbi:MAG: hypothetical protein VX672_04470, partial [Planctomycetota bacterium]|nr:hypothetical protein [Planctomycetota bacterium]